eukprot:4061-Heterococcus_DN1.PRE.2
MQLQVDTKDVAAAASFNRSGYTVLSLFLICKGRLTVLLMRCQLQPQRIRAAAATSTYQITVHYCL